MINGLITSGKNSTGNIVPTTRINLEYIQYNGDASSMKNENKLNVIIKNTLIIVAQIADNIIARICNIFNGGKPCKNINPSVIPIIVKSINLIVAPPKWLNKAYST